MSLSPLLIYGAGGFAREVAWLAESCRAHEVVAFVDDDPVNWGVRLNGIPVMGLDDAASRFPGAAVVGAIGSPRARSEVLEKARARGLVPATLVHPRVERSRWVHIGAGTVVCAGCILTTNIHIGDDVQINLDCTIGHDVVLADHATLAPGVHVSGNVHVGKRAYLGTGAVILNGTPSEPLVIGDDAVVGAGACVTKSVPAAVTVVGVPAKALARG